MKRGAKLGSVHRGSYSAQLIDMEVGERRYRETSLERYGYDMRQAVVARTRRTKILRSREFVAGLYTAVSSSRAGDVRYLICVERVK